MPMLTTRRNADLYLPKFQTNIGKCTLKYSGVVNWNKLLLEIKSIDNYHCFRKKVKILAHGEFKSLVTLTCLPPFELLSVGVCLRMHFAL